MTGPAGLLYVLSEPGAVPEAEFHDWYDTEHAPARLTVPGVRAGHRYRAADRRTPGWLACYDLDSTDILRTPAYARLRRRNPRERRLIDRLSVLDRRVYELLDEHGGGDGEFAADQPARDQPAVLLSVAMSTADEASMQALHDWYVAEHIPMLHAVPGWRGTRRYRRVEGSGPYLLVLHDLDSTAPFDTDAYRRAISTPRRERVMGQVTERERRVFAHHRAVAGGGGH